jgi:hypothetical protein
VQERAQPSLHTVTHPITPFSLSYVGDSKIAFFLKQSIKHQY